MTQNSKDHRKGSVTERWCQPFSGRWEAEGTDPWKSGPIKGLQEGRGLASRKLRRLSAAGTVRAGTRHEAASRRSARPSGTSCPVPEPLRRGPQSTHGWGVHSGQKHNSSSLGNLNKLSGDPRILTCAFLPPDKGPSHLVEPLTWSHSHSPRSRVLVIETPLLSSAHNLLPEFPLKGRIKSFKNLTWAIMTKRHIIQLIKHKRIVRYMRRMTIMKRGTKNWLQKK